MLRFIRFRPLAGARALSTLPQRFDLFYTKSELADQRQQPRALRFPRAEAAIAQPFPLTRQPRPAQLPTSPRKRGEVIVGAAGSIIAWRPQGATSGSFRNEVLDPAGPSRRRHWWAGLRFAFFALDSKSCP